MTDLAAPEDATPLLPEVREYLDTVRASGALPSELQPTVDDARRASNERRQRLMAEPTPMAEVRDLAVATAAGDVPVRCYHPTSGHLPGCVVWLHGGGWVLGDLDGTHAEASRVAHETGWLVASVGYRLAPEHPFPAGLEDCLNVVEWVLDHADELAVPDEHVCVGGISSGANLAAVVCQERRRLGRLPLLGQVLVVGVSDSAMDSGSWRRFGSGYLLDRTTCEWFFDHYVESDADRKDPRVAPLLGTQLAGLPPALVVTAEYDPLHDEGIAYAQRLSGAGVSVTLHDFPGVIHGFVGPLGSIEPSEQAFAGIGSFVRSLGRFVDEHVEHGR